jgi:uncharacterized protein YchJ
MDILKDPPPMAFTLKANGLLREIITDAKLSKFVPPEKLPTEKTVDVKALWDTGATGSVVTEATAKALGLVPMGKARCIYGGSETDENVYLVCIFLPNRVIFPAKVTECRNKTQFGLIIGMDIISKGDFSVTNKNNKTIVTFRVPSIAEHDYVEEENQKKKVIREKGLPNHPGKTTIKAPTKNHRVDGNLPCPCGSGKKWKQCHGKPKSPFHK